MRTVGVVKVEGLRELAQTLKDLPKATARNTLRRGLMKVAAPLAGTMSAMAPDDPATPSKDLKSSIGVSTRLSNRQARLHRKANRDDRDFAEVFVGAGPMPHAHLQEFGTVSHGPQPFARPAWDQHRIEMLEDLKRFLGEEIAKAAARYARKVAKGRR